MNSRRLRAVLAIAVVALAIAPRRIAAQAPAAPFLSTENLTKLRNLTLAPQNPATVLNPKLAVLFGLGDGNETISVKHIGIPKQQGVTFFIGFSIQKGADDIILSVLKPDASFFYLTDSTRALRAAAVLDTAGSRSITKEQAADGFQEALKRWGEVAAKSPEPPK